MLSNVKQLKDGGLRYSNIRIEEIPSDKFPTMVQLSKGPARLKSLIGRKFISLEKAVLAIDMEAAISMISGQKTTAKLEMVESGIVSIYEV
jgi:hypothetical protein